MGCFESAKRSVTERCVCLAFEEECFAADMLDADGFVVAVVSY